MSDILHIAKGLSVQPTCVLVLGARTEAMLNWLFSLTTTQVVLVEPEPAMFEKATLLHNAKGSPESVVIKHGVPAFEAKQKSMRYFASNVPGFSSVLPPNVIKSIRPALEFTEQEALTIELKPLLQQFNISEGRPCLLISQLNGAEQQCLNTQILNAFTHVVIQSSLKSVFGESKPVEKLKKELTECGRDYLELAESMPPFSNFVATKKVNAEQALNYYSQRLQHKEVKSALEGQLSVSQNKTEKVSEELRQAKQQFQAASQQKDEERKQLTDELQQIEHQLQTTKQQAAEKQKQLAEELRLVKQQFQESGQQNVEEQKQLTEELQHAQQRLQSINHKIAEGDDKINGLNDELASVRKLSEMHLKASETSNRLNLSLQADLNNLRAQYLEKLNEAESLTNLVNELYVKLKHAANYYHSLEDRASTTELTGNTRG